MASRSPGCKSTVIFVHGLWMNGVEMFWLRRQVEKHGFDTVRFVYPTVRNNVRVNADALHDFAHKHGTSAELHFVAHSLGGLVTLGMLANYSESLPPGRVVLLGSPVNGSHAARQLTEKTWARRLLGGSAEYGLLDDHTERWRGAREVGVIAGTRSLGLGRIWGGLPEPNDGTVAVAETSLETASDRIELPVTHASMLFSRRVSEAIISFLVQGKFRDDTSAVSGTRG